MNRILREMKERIGPLLALIHKASKQIEEAEKNGYEIKIECWGSSGRRPTTKNIKLTKFSKDFIESNGKDITPIAIKNILKLISKELIELQKEYYCVNVTGDRYNGSVRLYLEDVYIILTPNDYTQLFYE